MPYTLTLFPQLFTYSLLAPFILRIALAYIFINLGYLEITKEKKRWANTFELLGLTPASLFVNIMGVIEMIGGLMLLAGVYTQPVAMFFALLTFGELYVEYKEESILKRGTVFYFLMFAISISLVFSGAGFFAFDLPL